MLFLSFLNFTDKKRQVTHYILYFFKIQNHCGIWVREIIICSAFYFPLLLTIFFLSHHSSIPLLQANFLLSHLLFVLEFLSAILIYQYLTGVSGYSWLNVETPAEEQNKCHFVLMIEVSPAVFNSMVSVVENSLTEWLVLKGEGEDDTAGIFLNLWGNLF